MLESPQFSHPEKELDNLKKVYISAARRAREAFLQGLNGLRIYESLLDDDTEALFELFTQAQQTALLMYKTRPGVPTNELKEVINLSGFFLDDDLTQANRLINLNDPKAELVFPEDEIRNLGHILAILHDLTLRSNVSFASFADPIDNLDLGDIEFITTYWPPINDNLDRIHAIKRLRLNAETVLCRPDSMTRIREYLPVAHFFTAASL